MLPAALTLRRNQTERADGFALTLEELQAIYRVQFPVMRQNVADTWYDQNGRIVFTNNKGLLGVSFPENDKVKEFDSIVGNNLNEPVRRVLGLSLQP